MAAYVARHPIRSILIVIAGVALGTALFFFTRLGDLHSAVATEDFDPVRAATALAHRTPAQVEQSILELTEEQRQAFDAAAALDLSTFAIESEIAELIEQTYGRRPFVNAAAFSPELPDDMFDAYLGLGADASGSLADVVLLALAPTDGSAPILISLPRDLYVKNPCSGGWSRLNTGLGGCRGFASGTELMALMVQTYTGIEIDHVARVTFDGFAAVVEALGGTTICTDNPARDLKSGLNLPGGCAPADGYMTLAWVRSRHMEVLVDGTWRGVGGSDFARQERQRDILFQLANKVSSFGSLTSFDNTVRAVASGVRLDDGWSFADVVRTAWRYRGISDDRVKGFSVEVRNFRTSSGAQVLLPTVKFNSLLSDVYPAADR